MTIEGIKQLLNPYGIPYKQMTVGKKVTVLIPIPDKKHVLVEGIITKEIWKNSSDCFYSQINITKQCSETTSYSLAGIMAIYPEKIQKISEAK